MDNRVHTVRNGLICVFLVLLCILIAYPVAELNLMDDWSYTWSALIFARTGHIVYAWSSPILGWQIFWGALFIKLFGFSFTAVRASMLPVALLSVYLFHSILRRFGVAPRNALIGTLTLGLSPLFLPLAASFMNDVPGLFCILLCLYLCQRSVAASTAKTTLLWLCLAASSNVLLGTVRQIAWLGVLVIVPSTAWLLRRRRGVLPAAALFWAASCACIYACMKWFSRQPGSIHEPLFRATTRDSTHPALYLIFALMSALLLLLLVVYPVLIAWLSQARSLSRAGRARLAATSVIFSLFSWKFQWVLPWLFYVLILEFDASKAGPVLGGSVRSLPWPLWLRVALSLFVVLTAQIAAEHLFSRPWKSSASGSTSSAPQWREVLWLTGPYALAYTALLIPRALFNVISERYLLGLMPVAILFLLLLYQQWVAPNLPASSIAALSIFALFAVAGTHDWFAAYRARLTAINEVRASGVPRSQIQGGFEYDNWTQLENAGRIDSDSDNSQHPRSGGCRYFYASFAPTVHPKYTVLFPDAPCVTPSQFPPVTYRTWLPPYHRQIEVEKLPGNPE